MTRSGYKKRFFNLELEKKAIEEAFDREETALLSALDDYTENHTRMRESVRDLCNDALECLNDDRVPITIQNSQTLLLTGLLNSESAVSSEVMVASAKMAYNDVISARDAIIDLLIDELHTMTRRYAESSALVRDSISLPTARVLLSPIDQPEINNRDTRASVSLRTIIEENSEDTDNTFAPHINGIENEYGD
jgi:hypothetical protein